MQAMLATSSHAHLKSTSRSASVLSPSSTGEAKGGGGGGDVPELRTNRNRMMADVQASRCISIELFNFSAFYLIEAAGSRNLDRGCQSFSMIRLSSFHLFSIPLFSFRLVCRHWAGRTHHTPSLGPCMTGIHGPCRPGPANHCLMPSPRTFKSAMACSSTCSTQWAGCADCRCTPCHQGCCFFGMPMCRNDSSRGVQNNHCLPGSSLRAVRTH